MPAKSTMLLTFLFGFGCGAQAQPPHAPAPVARRDTPIAPGTAASARVDPPKETLAEADRAFEAQLGLARGGQFDVFRQVTELKRAILLYTQFIERAEGNPELLPAVKKAKERIDDAERTIVFLDPSQSSEPPLAPARE
jgi:hypothetical protein